MSGNVADDYRMPGAGRIKVITVGMSVFSKQRIIIAKAVDELSRGYILLLDV